MSDTYGRVTADAEAQYNTKFAGQVREYWDATLLPPPFNLIEHFTNFFMESRQEAKENHYSNYIGNMRSSLWGRHYVWPLPDAHFDLSLRNHGLTALDDNSRVQKEILASPVILKDLRHVTAGLSKQIHQNREQMEKNFRSSNEKPRDHLVVQVVDPNAVVTEGFIGYRLASELGVADTWKSDPEHSRCVAGTRGDVVGETVCGHPVGRRCTAECCVAVRLHSDRRVILFRKVGVRVAAVPGGIRSRSFREFAAPEGRIHDDIPIIPVQGQQQGQPAPPMGSDPGPRKRTAAERAASKQQRESASSPSPSAAASPQMMDKMQALEAANTALAQEVQSMRAGMDDKMDAVSAELRRILEATVANSKA